MVMPVDTHWKTPTPGVKLRVMTGSSTSFTFMLGGTDTHSNDKRTAETLPTAQSTPPPPSLGGLR